MAECGRLGRNRVDQRRLLRGAAGASIGVGALWLAACRADEKKSTSAGSTSNAPAAQGAAPATQTAAQLDQFKFTNNAPALKATPKKSGTFKFSTHVKPPSLDPIESAPYESANIYTLVYNRLIRGEYGTELQPYNPWRLKIKGDVAESWEHPDPMTYTFKIRQNVKFQNVAPVSGRAFTSADAKYSLDAFLANVETASLLPFTVQAPDAQTVKLTLTKPANY